MTTILPGQRQHDRRICRFASIVCAVTPHVFVWLWNPEAEPHGPARDTQRIAPYAMYNTQWATGNGKASGWEEEKRGAGGETCRHLHCLHV